MPPASRILVMVLVALAGVLAGFLSYRNARAPASIVALAPPAARAVPAQRSRIVYAEGEDERVLRARFADRFRTRYRT